MLLHVIGMLLTTTRNAYAREHALMLDVKHHHYNVTDEPVTDEPVN